MTITIGSSSYLNLMKMKKFTDSIKLQNKSALEKAVLPVKEQLIINRVNFYKFK